MDVEYVGVDFAHDLIRRVGQARAEALRGFERIPPAGAPDEACYWERVLEANAALVLAELRYTALAPGMAVRYRFYEMRGGELLARPFVARADVDVEPVRRVLDWHPPPDSGRAGVTHDAELLYAHFTLERTAAGVFEYWFGVQEIWASSRWAHGRVLVTPDELGQVAARPDWRIDHVVEHSAPAVVHTAEPSSHLAVLVYTPLGTQRVTLEQVVVGADKVVRYGSPVLVAEGPRGWVV